MGLRIRRYIGAPDYDHPGNWTVKALVELDGRKAWVLASGATHQEALQRCQELVKAQQQTWEASKRG